MTGRVTSLEYAQISNNVYNIDKRASASGNKSWQVGKFKCGLFKEGMSWGATNTDFKGCVYAAEDRREVVVAFQGTVPSKGGDILSDVQIAIGGLVGMLPQYCGAAMRLLERTSKAFPGYSISLTGHSLGGGMAQVLGHWSGLPFATFNAPGMWGDIQKSKVALAWSPTNSLNSFKGTFKGPMLAKQTAATGRNFRNVFDPVSAYGMHYGPVTRFWGTGMHAMADVLERIRNSKWAHVNPFDPNHKEWGEL